MKITLLLVGKTTSRPLIQMIDDYAQRIVHFVNFSIQVIPELKNTRSLTPEQQKELEGCEILNHLRPTDHVILLDEHGTTLRSLDFAQQIEKHQLQGLQHIIYIVGGPYGFSPSVYQRANKQLSLSPMTFSHQMIRLLFVEQLYRAITIINHLPYHHE